MLQSTPQMLFSTGPRVLDARFDLDALTSDGGLVWIAKADVALGPSASLAEQISEWRR